MPWTSCENWYPAGLLQQHVAFLLQHENSLPGNKGQGVEIHFDQEQLEHAFPHQMKRQQSLYHWYGQVLTVHPAVATERRESWDPKEKRSLNLDRKESEIPNIVPRICTDF